MASFRTHISFGIAAGIVGAIVLSALSIVDAPGTILAAVVALVLGSILPDMDSDSGIPFHVAFGSFSLVSCALIFMSSYEKTPSDWQGNIVTALGASIFVWVVVGYVFKRFTKHRGMAHSIPAALLSGLVTFFVASRFSFSDPEAFLLGVAMTSGYLVHLVLDEVWAAVNFHGIPFIPNKALGSALKVFSSSTFSNVVVYGAISFLLLGNMNRLSPLFETFWSQVSRVT
ncbi:MAG: metal-dependent hydrolase [Candidatus Moranbacteria bacterium]|nr:metal-dependent hydrolase [Candidatus Moranbacteria bacterium]